MQCLATIKSAIPAQPPGTTWSTIWSQVSKQIGSKQTLANNLQKLVNTGQVIKDGKCYRLNPALHYDYVEGMRIWLGTEAPKAKATAFPETSFTDPSIFRPLTEAIFDNTYRLYITMLNELVQISSRAAADELVHLFMRAEVMPVLSDYALDVWRNRAKMNIVETLGSTHLRQSDSPRKWISRKPVAAFERFAKQSPSTAAGRKASRHLAVPTSQASA
jgi:hypothetical protein